MGSSFLRSCMFRVLLLFWFCSWVVSLSGDLDLSLLWCGLGGGRLFSLSGFFTPALSRPETVSSVQFMLAMLSMRSLVVSIFFPPAVR